MQWKGLKYQSQDFSDKYIISEYGEVQNILTGTILKQSTNRGGYKYVCISLPRDLNIGIRKTIIIHKAVAYTFLPVSSETTVDHVDGNKSNNHYTNLEWVSSYENSKRAYEKGLSVPPPPESYQKLNDDKVFKILMLLDEGNMSHQSIANMFNVSRSTISQIYRGDIHKKSINKYRGFLD